MDTPMPGAWPLNKFRLPEVSPMRAGNVLALIALLAAYDGGSRAEPVLSAVPVEGSSRDLPMLVGDWEASS
jgi:hypothetical protein